MSSIYKFIIILLVFFMKGCVEPEAIAPSEQGVVAINPEYFDNIEEQIKPVADKYALEIIKPSGPVQLSDKQAFLLVLKEREQENKFYCATFDNVKNIHQIEYKFFKEGCKNVVLYDQLTKEVKEVLLSVAKLE